MLEGLGKVPERHPQIRGSLICGKLAGGDWCFSQTNYWIQGPSKSEIVVGINDILTNVIAGPWNWFSAL